MMPPDIVGPKMDPEQLYESVIILLSLQVSFNIITEHTLLYMLLHDESFYVNFLLVQSKNGGVTAWEPARGQEWLEVRTKSPSRSYYIKRLVK